MRANDPCGAPHGATMTGRVHVVSDRSGARASLADAVESGDVRTESSDLEDLLSQPSGTGEVVVLDLRAAPDELAATIIEVRTHVGGPVIALLDDVQESSLLTVLGAGAAGVVLRASGASVIANAVRAANDGGVFIDPVLGSTLAEVVSVMVRTDGDAVLTPTELRVLQRFPRGLTNAQIAEELDVSINTVKTHVRHILAKLECGNRVQAVRVARERGLVS